MSESKSWPVERDWDRPDSYKRRTWLPEAYTPGECVACEREADLRTPGTTFFVTPFEVRGAKVALEIHLACMRTPPAEAERMRAKLFDRVSSEVLMQEAFPAWRRFVVPEGCAVARPRRDG